ncbi:MAG TPA: GNAT family N-acetyltransferase [Arenicellales bacterium]|nr:GNAT family N-acetyltransferase [Arenicellales bacterium]
MIQLQPPYRPALADDATALAELVNMAGEGMPLYLWSGMAESGQSPWDVGRERAMRESGGFSYRNAVVLEHGEDVAACLIGYPLEDDPAPADYADMPPMFVPLQQLEDLAPGTWYLNVLATYPEHRGRGFGRGLLEVAEAIAADEGKSGLSIIVSDANAAARRLYDRQGYIERDKRPMVKNGWKNHGANWVLLIKEL